MKLLIIMAIETKLHILKARERQRVWEREMKMCSFACINMSRHVFQFYNIFNLIRVSNLNLNFSPASI